MFRIRGGRRPRPSFPNSRAPAFHFHFILTVIIHVFRVDHLSMLIQLIIYDYVSHYYYQLSVGQPVGGGFHVREVESPVLSEFAST